MMNECAPGLQYAPVFENRKICKISSRWGDKKKKQPSAAGALHAACLMFV